MAESKIQVEVAYARPDRQEILAVELERGATVADAIRLSRIGNSFPEIDIANASIGVFGKRGTMATVLNPGDRVEIYRPLVADPKQARRQRAARGTPKRRSQTTRER